MSGERKESAAAEAGAALLAALTKQTMNITPPKRTSKASSTGINIGGASALRVAAARSFVTPEKVSEKIAQVAVKSPTSTDVNYKSFDREQTHLIFNEQENKPKKAESIELSPITIYNSKHELGQNNKLVAVNSNFICYALRNGDVRVIHKPSVVRAALPGPGGNVTDIAFINQTEDCLGVAYSKGKMAFWSIAAVQNQEEENGDNSERFHIECQVKVKLDLLEPVPTRFCTLTHAQGTSILAANGSHIIILNFHELQAETNKKAAEAMDDTHESETIVLSKDGSLAAATALNKSFVFSENYSMWSSDEDNLTCISVIGSETGEQYAVAGSKSGTLYQIGPLYNCSFQLQNLMFQSGKLRMYSTKVSEDPIDSVFAFKVKKKHYGAICGYKKNSVVSFIPLPHQDVEPGLLMKRQALEFVCNNKGTNVEESVFNNIALEKKSMMLVCSNVRNNTIYFISTEADEEGLYFKHLKAFQNDKDPIISQEVYLKSLSSSNDKICIYCVQTLGIYLLEYASNECMTIIKGIMKKDNKPATDALADKTAKSKKESPKTQANKANKLTTVDKPISTVPETKSAKIEAAHIPSRKESPPQMHGQNRKDKKEKENNNGIGIASSTNYAVTDKVLSESQKKLEGKLESIVSQKIETLQSSIEDLMAKKDLANQAQMTKLLTAVSSTVLRDLPMKIQDIVEMNSKKMMSGILPIMRSALVELVEEQLPAMVKEAVGIAFKEQFESAIIPSFENTCRIMFSQMHHTLQQGLISQGSIGERNLSESTEMQQVKALADSLQKTERKLSQLLLASGKSNLGNKELLPMGSAKMTLEEIERVQDPTIIIGNLLQKNTDSAFQSALNYHNEEILIWTCKQVDVQTLFSKVDLRRNIPMQGATLLGLLGELGRDMTSDREVKMKWIPKIILALDVNNDCLSPFQSAMLKICEMVYQNLQRASAGGLFVPAELSNVEVTKHILNSYIHTLRGRVNM